MYSPLPAQSIENTSSGGTFFRTEQNQLDSGAPLYREAILVSFGRERILLTCKLTMLEFVPKEVQNGLLVEERKPKTRKDRVYHTNEDCPEGKRIEGRTRWRSNAASGIPFLYGV